ncbi:MAG: hypothetical protein MI922_06210 [Bacteroidales bacterium]|nr:hypothetical protein [Bacteroidales bacterium]
MSKDSKIEFVDAKVERDEIKGFNLKGVFDGSILAGIGVLKHLPFVLFLALLTLGYIGNRYHAERKIREIAQKDQQVKNLRAEQITTASELMNLSKPSRIESLVQTNGLGLEPSKEPPIKIVKKK